MWGCSPEEKVLANDDAKWQKMDTPLPYDRYKRDIYYLAFRMLMSTDWEVAEEDLQLEQLQTEQHSLVSLPGTCSTRLISHTFLLGRALSAIRASVSD